AFGPAEFAVRDVRLLRLRSGRPTNSISTRKFTAMKTIVISALRTSALVAALFLVPALSAAEATTPGNRAAQLLATTGSVPLQAASPYVEVGTLRIQV